MALAQKGVEKDELSAEEVAFDAILGLLLLRADPWDLKSLSKMPDVLDRIGLHCASAALMYALGYENELREHFFVKAENEQEMHAFFLKWRDQPASKELAEGPLLYEEQKVTLRSQLLGCDIAVKSDNVSPCVELAESVLAALESLLSTGMVTWIGIREPVLTVTVRKSDFAQEPFEFELRDETGRPHIEILCAAFEPHGLSTKAQGKLHEQLFMLVATIFARIVVARDVPQVFEKLLRDERALDRSVNFTGSFVTLGNVLGPAPKNRLSLWPDQGCRDYQPKRLKAWDADAPAVTDVAEPRIRPLIPGEGDPPESLLDPDRVKHSEIRTVSLIRETLWEKAKWFGTAYAGAEDDSVPPFLLLMFRNRDAARQIFHYWNLELGNRDTEERLRVSIVRGINTAKPHFYRVVVGSNPAHEFRNPGIQYAVFVSRMSTMEPDSSVNLERFLTSYQKIGSYFLGAATVVGEAFTSGLRAVPVQAC
jgi:hypothetical protein